MTTDKGADERAMALLDNALCVLRGLEPRIENSAEYLGVLGTLDRARQHITALAAERDALKEECEHTRLALYNISQQSTEPHIRDYASSYFHQEHGVAAMKTLPVKCETVNASTGKVEKTETVKFGIMPPKPGTCSVCGVVHHPCEPHDAQSLYYQYTFYDEHGRWPTWADAIAHCEETHRNVWKSELMRMGKWSELDGALIAKQED